VPPLMSEPSFTALQNYTQNCTFVYFNFYGFTEEMRKIHSKLILETGKKVFNKIFTY
jgi:hypothetical protein